MTERPIIGIEGATAIDKHLNALQCDSEVDVQHEHIDLIHSAHFDRRRNTMRMNVGVRLALKNKGKVPKPTIALIGLQDAVAYMLVEVAQKFCNVDVQKALNFVGISVVNPLLNAMCRPT